jgi:hypothetical protein
MMTGCLIGMVPLLFLDTEVNHEKARKKEERAAAIEPA